MKNTSLRSSLLLLLTATIWGVAFVAQSVGMDYVGPFTFNCIRCILGGVVLIPCIFMLDGIRRKGHGPGEAERKLYTWKQKELFAGGVCCGAALFVASSLQQFGIKYTTVGKAGFITALYIVIVPLIGIFLRKTAGIKIWVSVALAVAGLYLLCMTGGLSLGAGDLLVLLCAAAFSVHIMIVDYFSPRVDGVRMSCIQFFVCGILSGVGMALTEQPQMGLILQAWMPIGYAGIFSCGVAYTLQIVGQKGMNPTVASLIMSMESVVSVLAGWVLLGQTLSLRELSGCVLMFAAIILAQMPERRHGWRKEKA